MDRAPSCHFVAVWPWVSCFIALILFSLWNVEISLVRYRGFYEDKMKLLKRILCYACGPRPLSLGGARIPLLFL